MGGVVHDNGAIGGASTTENNKNKNVDDAVERTSKKGKFSLPGDAHHPSQFPSPSPILTTKVVNRGDSKERARSRSRPRSRDTSKDRTMSQMDIEEY